MLSLSIPGQGLLEVNHLVLDFNGTIALDGKVIEGVKERLETISQSLEIHVITADTNGSVHRECVNLPVKVYVIGKDKQDDEKERFIHKLKGSAIAIGNGVNDEKMFKASALALALQGKEGVSMKSLLSSDIVFQHIHDALDLILKPNRLIATLRK